MVNFKQKNTQPETVGLAYELWIIFRSALWGLILSLICFMLIAVIVNISNIQETMISPVVQGVKLISLAISGMLAAVAAGSRGWLKGGLAGFVYILLALIIISIIDPGPLTLKALANDIIMAFIAGAIGGIIGITLKNR